MAAATNTWRKWNFKSHSSFVFVSVQFKFRSFLHSWLLVGLNLRGQLGCRKLSLRQSVQSRFLRGFFGQVDEPTSQTERGHGSTWKWQNMPAIVFSRKVSSQDHRKKGQCGKFEKNMMNVVSRIVINVQSGSGDNATNEQFQSLALVCWHSPLSCQVRVPRDLHGGGDRQAAGARLLPLPVHLPAGRLELAGLHRPYHRVSTHLLTHSLIHSTPLSLFSRKPGLGWLSQTMVETVLSFEKRSQFPAFLSPWSVRTLVQTCRKW